MLCFSSGDISDLRAGSIPLFSEPRGAQKAFKHVPHRAQVMYVGYDGTGQSIMIQVIHGEDIGWTYLACGRDLVLSYPAEFEPSND